MKTLYSVLLSITCLSTFGQLQKPTQNGNIFTFQNKNVVMEIDKSYGGRIKSVKINSIEFLYQNCDFASAYTTCGSTLWPSPESSWGYPPPQTLDHYAYTGGIKDNSVFLRSGSDPTLKIAFSKTFSADAADTSFTMVYTIKNPGASSVSFACREVTRVFSSGGLFFFPADANAVGDSKGNPNSLSNLFSYSLGNAWFKQKNSDPSKQKVFSDGKGGWMAYIDKDRRLIVKKFQDLTASQFAPNEKEIEFWYSDKDNYYELENESKYAVIKASDSTSWTMKWYLRQLPVGINANVGDQKLLDYVNHVVNGWINTSVPEDESVQLSFSPNPANSEIVIRSAYTNSRVEVSIKDLNGREVAHFAAINGQHLPLSLANGIYICTLNSGKQKYSNKLVISK